MAHPTTLRRSTVSRRQPRAKSIVARSPSPELLHASGKTEQVPFGVSKERHHFVLACRSELTARVVVDDVRFRLDDHPGFSQSVRHRHYVSDTEVHEAWRRAGFE